METYDYIVIGSGSSGIASASRVGIRRAGALLVEGNEIGGTCVNVGCVPKKVMWQANSMMEMMERDTAGYGFDAKIRNFSFRQLIENRERYIDFLHGAYNRGLDSNNIERIHGYATSTGEQTIKVNGTEYMTPHILIATGSRPKKLDIPGEEYALDSNGFFTLEEMPKRVVFVGTGHIVVELAGTLHGLGAETYRAFRHERPLRSSDDMLSEKVVGHYQEMNMRVHPNATPAKIEKTAWSEYVVTFENDESVTTDAVIFGIDRQPNTDQLGLESTKVALDEKGYVKIDKFQDTTQNSIYAVGDAIGKIDLAPTAIVADRRLSERLFNGQTGLYLDYSLVPAVVFTHPPVMTTGLTEEAALEEYGEDQVKIYRSSFTPIYFALGEYRQKCGMKLTRVGKEERIVGLHGIGIGVDEMLQGFIVAIKVGTTKADFDNIVAIHPAGPGELVAMR